MSKSGREQVSESDIARLRPRQWLNDEIINFYGQLMMSRSESQKKNQTSIPKDTHINGFPNGIKGKGKAETVEKKPLDVHYFSTFFWPKLTGEGYAKGRLAKWTKKVSTSALNIPPSRLLILRSHKFDLFSKDVVLIPINHNNSHWTAAAIDFRKKRIHSYDSMGTARSEVHKVVAALLFIAGLVSLLSKALRGYLDEEHRNKKKKPFDFTGWVDWADEVCC